MDLHRSIAGHLLRIMLNKRKIGILYEKQAGIYLEMLGYEILEYNYRCKAGEIDIVAKDGEYLVFCEVKYRRDERKGAPTEAVNLTKQKILSKCALYYITGKGLGDVPCRFDVVGICGTQIELIKNAFDYIG